MERENGFLELIDGCSNGVDWWKIMWRARKRYAAIPQETKKKLESEDRVTGKTIFLKKIQGAP